MANHKCKLINYGKSQTFIKVSRIHPLDLHIDELGQDRVEQSNRQPKHTEAAAQDGHKLHVQPNIAAILTVPLMLHHPRPGHFHVLMFWHSTNTSHWTVSAMKVCESRNRLLLLRPVCLFFHWVIVVKWKPFSLAQSSLLLL